MAEQLAVKSDPPNLGRVIITSSMSAKIGLVSGLDPATAVHCFTSLMSAKIGLASGLDPATAVHCLSCIAYPQKYAHLKQNVL